MKNSSICWGSILISCFLLCGCTSSKSDTTTCSINGQGLQDEQIITSVDGNVTVLEERLEIDLLDLGASKENIETIDEEDLRALFESQIPQLADTIEGVQVDYQLEDEKAIFNMRIDFDKADTKTLSDMGIIDADTSNIRLDGSIEALEKQGYTCK
ncbi:DUF1307 domain-containing protein [Merdibacter massiliensis]|uniref:DUF1307 domain-containing protein n=1 Tax=Merdibacter massiliensis TaxID=1871030 RepID=UPI00096AAD1D|nr:DUF1307 domain-containing protein [Merdibacter massiliensis]